MTNNKPTSLPRWALIAGIGALVVLLLCGVGALFALSQASSLTAAATPVARAATPTVVPTPSRPATAPTATVGANARTATPTTSARATPTSNPYLMRNQKIYDVDGRLAYQGDIDLKPVFDRIAAGIKDPHPNDGVVFQNRERLLPVKSDTSYYHEYVVRTPGLSAVGPQRLILGRDGEAYYTPDHYDTFIRVK